MKYDVQRFMWQIIIKSIKSQMFSILYKEILMNAIRAFVSELF